MNANTRVSKNQLYEISLRLGDRNKEVLATIRSCRYITTRQISRLHFSHCSNQEASIRATNRNLKTMRDFGLLETLSRRIGGAYVSNTSSIWTITQVGVRLLSMRNWEDRTRVRSFAPSPYFVEHTLMASETYVRLAEIARKHDLKLVCAELEPECWRQANDSRGKKCAYKPDLYAVLRVDKYEDYYFIEIDLGTEASAAIIDKRDRSLAYCRTGAEQKKNSVFPYIVWIASTDKRKSRLRTYLARNYDKKPDLFVVITPDELESLITDGVDKYRQTSKQKGGAI